MLLNVVTNQLRPVSLNLKIFKNKFNILNYKSSDKRYCALNNSAKFENFLKPKSCNVVIKTKDLVKPNFFNSIINFYLNNGLTAKLIFLYESTFKNRFINERNARKEWAV